MTVLECVCVCVCVCLEELVRVCVSAGEREREMENTPTWVDELRCQKTIVGKKVMNEPARVAEDMIDGMLEAHPELARLDGYPDIKVVLRRRRETQAKVAVVSGGGSGHEPAHAGFVGQGMLNAAVCGDVFASPSVDAVLAAILAVAGSTGSRGGGDGGGVLLIVKNYTGDRLNFGIAAEMAKARGIAVEMLIVGDDCALPNEGIVGRRGIAGTVLVHKIAGAAAEANLSLAQVFALASRAAANIGTLGVSFSHCTVPGAASAEPMGVGEMEVGLGIHGEAGARVAPVAGANAIAQIIIDGILDPTNNYMDLESDAAAAKHGVVLLVNNLGGSTAMEMSIAARAALRYLRETKKINVVRLGVGNFMTALDMQGLSMTLMKVDEDLLKLLDADTAVHTWSLENVSGESNTDALPPAIVPVPVLDNDASAAREFGGSGTLSPESATAFKACVVAACKALIASEEELNRLDATTGDGDTGSTLARGANAILARLVDDSADEHVDWSDAARSVAAIGRTCRRSMGGTSGALYDIMFTAAGTAMRAEAATAATGAALWVDAFDAGVKAIIKYGNAKVGYRTMIDALFPALAAMQSHGATREGVAAAATQAAAGAADTKAMAGLAGRSSYVRKDVLDGTADPGATAVSIWMRAVADAL